MQDLQNEAQAGRLPLKKSPIMLAASQQMREQPKRSVVLIRATVHAVNVVGQDKRLDLFAWKCCNSVEVKL
jgi:hypothetical protein